MAHTTRHAQARLLLGTTAQGHEAHAVELEPFSDPPQHGGPGRPGAPPWLATVHEVMPLPSNVLVVPPTTQLNSMLTQLHDSQTQASEFAFACKRIGTMVVEAATALLPYRPRTVELPTGGTYTGVELDTAHMCAVSSSTPVYVPPVGSSTVRGRYGSSAVAASTTMVPMRLHANANSLACVCESCSWVSIEFSCVVGGTTSTLDGSGITSCTVASHGGAPGRPGPPCCGGSLNGSSSTAWASCPCAVVPSRSRACAWRVVCAMTASSGGSGCTCLLYTSDTADE